MSETRSGVSALRGELEAETGRFPFRALQASSHALLVDFPGSDPVPDGTPFTRAEVAVNGKSVQLGRGVFHVHATHPHRRGDDEPPPGVGYIVFHDDVYDFASLFKDGAVAGLGQKLRQLTVVWGRKQEIRPSFRDFTADLAYDLQVYRAVFDNIDRTLEHSPAEMRAEVQGVAVERAYPGFCELFDRGIKQLEVRTQKFTKQEHERHGFYFRKQLWDMIAASEFLRRTNLKPRGYAGDSVMMRMLYEDRFVGRTIFAQMMHRHPVQSAAAQAVRNRRAMIAHCVEDAHARHGRPGQRTRVMSVACGPAWELGDVLTGPEKVELFEFTLLDQDMQALAEACGLVERIAEQTNTPVQGQFIRESVRTMLRRSDLPEKWGRHHFIYSMGLFDYLIEPVARAVLAKLYQLLEPGGELLVGNFHSRNPTRTYMEYWMDWVLFYRTEEELLDLASDLPGAEASCQFEDTRSQLFLRVRKLG